MKMVAVRLWDGFGRPLLGEYEEDEPEPYRRRLIGFVSPAERIADERIHRSGTVGPLDEPLPELENDLESFLIDLEEEAAKAEVVQW